jgi:hypothetical protein
MILCAIVKGIRCSVGMGQEDCSWELVVTELFGYRMSRNKEGSYGQDIAIYILKK